MVEHQDAHRAHLHARFINGPWKGHIVPDAENCRICALDIELMDAIHPGWRNP